MDDSPRQFVKLWTRFQPEVKRYIRAIVPSKADAEDVLQETATVLWDKFGEYDPERPFVSWAIRFAYNKVLTWRRDHARDRLVFSENLLARIDSHFNEKLTLLEVRRIALESCLQKLNDQDRHLLLRCHGHHGSIREEAGRTKVTERKLYHWVEKLRAGLLKCIDSTLAKEASRDD